MCVCVCVCVCGCNVHEISGRNNSLEGFWQWSCDARMKHLREVTACRVHAECDHNLFLAPYVRPSLRACVVCRGGLGGWMCKRECVCVWGGDTRARAHTEPMIWWCHM